METEILEQLIVVLERIAAQLETLNDDADRYDYAQTWHYDIKRTPTTPGMIKSVQEYRREGWKVYRTANDADGDITYYMRRPRNYGA